jgi:hypothetical protein
MNFSAERMMFLRMSEVKPPEAKPKKKLGCGAALVLVVDVAFVAAIFSRFQDRSAPIERAYQAKVEKQRADETTSLQIATRDTKLVSFSWQKGGFDNVMLATRTFRRLLRKCAPG